MEGVEHVQQLDDTRLHWIAKVGGKTNEWDAKILEQHPDKQRESSNSPLPAPVTCHAILVTQPDASCRQRRT
jgi:hypothetical protein